MPRRDGAEIAPDLRVSSQRCLARGRLANSPRHRAGRRRRGRFERRGLLRGQSLSGGGRGSRDGALDPQDRPYSMAMLRQVREIGGFEGLFFFNLGSETTTERMGRSA